jgi:AcrR family transcriptional regulator
MRRPRVAATATVGSMQAEPERRSPGRPLAAPRDAVEEVALALMIRDGYENVSVDAIASAAGIGRTTFFRYFGSKPGVIWSAFDDTITWLDEALQATAADTDPLDAVRAGIVSSTRSAINTSDVWLERFTLLDTNAALRADAHEHWERWKDVIASFLGTRTNAAASGAVAMAIAGACQGVFLAELRHWLNTDDSRDALLTRLDNHLDIVGTALRPLVTA